MANGIFNIARGRGRVWYDAIDGNLAAAAGGITFTANSALVIVLLKSAGLVADATLADYDDLSALLAGASDEADFTNYARKILTDADIGASAQDDTNERLDLDIPDQTWTAAGGGTNNTLGKLLVCVDSDTTGGTDSSIVPWTFHDFTATTDGNDLVAQIAAAGFYRSA